MWICIFWPNNDIPGTPASSHNPKTCRLIGDFKLPLGVNVSASGCLSLYVSPVINWWPSEDKWFGQWMDGWWINLMRRLKILNIFSNILQWWKKRMTEQKVTGLNTCQNMRQTSNQALDVWIHALLFLLDPPCQLLYPNTQGDNMPEEYRQWPDRCKELSVCEILICCLWHTVTRGAEYSNNMRWHHVRISSG